MSVLHIVTDGAADMPVEWEHEYDIRVLPLRVQFGEDTYTQGPGFTRKDFYRLVNEKRMIPKTSLPSPGQVVAFYRSIAKAGDTILSIHISSKLSGTFATVQSAARELAQEYEIHVFDSGAGSLAQGFMAREARMLERAGAPLRQILQRLESIRNTVTIIFTLDTVEFAYLSGRINALQNLLSVALQVKPIIVLKEGLLSVADKVRTRRRALNRVIDRVCDRFGSRLVNIAVVHAADPQMGQEMLAKIRMLFNTNEALVAELSIPVAAHLGPGAIGIVAYPAKEEN
jgi:DegV family protein with EDD domain